MLSTDSILIRSRTMSKRFESDQPLRSTQIVTFEPSGPLSMRTASSIGMETVETSPIREITSPAFKPARDAGVPSRGETIVSLLSRTEITIPRPPNSPLVEVFISANASGFSKTEWGSSVARAPLTAAYSMARTSCCGGRYFSKNRKTSRSLRLISQRLSTSSI